MTPNLTTGADLFGTWLADVETGTPPPRFVLAAPFAALDVRPGRLILLGGGPGSGKTAALLQAGIDLLRLNEGVRLLFANVEMSPLMLAERIVSRVSAVPLTAIADRTLTAHELERVRIAVGGLAPIAGRLAFMGTPFALEHVAAAADSFAANVLILDYLQRFTVGADGTDKREQLDAAVTVLRRFCDGGAAVLCAAAVARQKSAHGSTYRGLNLASFRGSSELEFGADACYLVNPESEGEGVTFTCEKNRYGAAEDIATQFDPTLQTFVEAPKLAGLDAFDAATPAKPDRKGTKGV